jgi:hypothetical protein
MNQDGLGEERFRRMPLKEKLLWHANMPNVRIIPTNFTIVMSAGRSYLSLPT